MRLAVTDSFKARWTDRIHDEWIRNLLKNRPDLTLQQLERTKTLMNSSIIECLVEDYEQLESTLNLPDEDDKHVLAAAIKCGAQAIITFNLKDFPQATLSNYNIEAVGPDEFIQRQINTDKVLVFRVLKTHRMSLRAPPKSSLEYLDSLEKSGLVISANILRNFADDL
jgi:predicted nucleic acid-binding protein